jgi:hypothetical protein
MYHMKPYFNTAISRLFLPPSPPPKRTIIRKLLDWLQKGDNDSTTFVP